MGFPEILTTALLDSGLAQYPNKNLMRAAILLQPQERPTVPVRLYTDPDKLYKDVLQPLHTPPLTKNATGVTTDDKKTIYINRNADAFNDPALLAGMLAHEQVHVKQPNYDRTEASAYQRQLDVVNRLMGEGKINPNYQHQLSDYADTVKRREQKGTK